MEAADNVVHAYDLNMQVPDSPAPPVDDAGEDIQPAAADRRPNILIEGSNIPIKRGKRRGSDSFERMAAPVAKRRWTESQNPSPQRDISPSTAILPSCLGRASEPLEPSSIAIKTQTRADHKSDSPRTPDNESRMEISDIDSTATPGLRHTKIRELLHVVVHESLRTGGRPESAISEDTDHGEIIEVRTRASIGTVCTKLVEWSVDPLIPETIFSKHNLPHFDGRKSVLIED